MKRGLQRLVTVGAILAGWVLEWALDELRDRLADYLLEAVLTLLQFKDEYEFWLWVVLIVVLKKIWADRKIN